MNTGDPQPMYGWNTLDWQKIERKVFKLQKRIYRAQQRGDDTTSPQAPETLDEVPVSQAVSGASGDARQPGQEDGGGGWGHGAQPQPSDWTWRSTCSLDAARHTRASGLDSQTRDTRRRGPWVSRPSQDRATPSRGQASAGAGMGSPV